MEEAIRFCGHAFGRAVALYKFQNEFFLCNQVHQADVGYFYQSFAYGIAEGAAFVGYQHRTANEGGFECGCSARNQGSPGVSEYFIGIALYEREGMYVTKTLVQCCGLVGCLCDYCGKVGKPGYLS